jgi:ankyrin repeat protein
MKGKLKTLKGLLQMGADVDFRDEHGWSAAMHASSEGRMDVLELLLPFEPDLSFKDLSDGWTALHFAATAGAWKIAELLVKAGAPIGARDVVSWSPLMHAAAHQIETLKVILQAKPAQDILDMQDQMGMTALHEAAGNGNVEATRQLVMAGADRTIRDDYGETPWMLAEKQNFGEVAAVLKPPAPRAEL